MAYSAGGAASAKLQRANQLLGEIAANAIGEDRDLRENVGAWLVGRPSARHALPMPLSPVRTPITRAAVGEHRLAGKPHEQIDALGFDLLGQPFGERAERDDVVAVIAERRRRDRQANLGVGGEVDRCCPGVPRSRAARPWPENRESARAASTDRATRPRADAHRPRAPSRSRQSTAASPPFCFCSCARRKAAERPAGPPPTIRTSTSSVSRSAIVARLGV